MANAALPFDMFTSSPDFSPFTYTPRTWPLACDAAATPQEKALTTVWDFDEPDEQPGLDDQVTRYMMGSMDPAIRDRNDLDRPERPTFRHSVDGR